MTENKTTNYEFDLITDSDSLKSAIKTKANANIAAIDAAVKEVSDRIPSLTGYATESYVSSAISGKVDSSDLATVATSGSYSDLINTPTLGTAASSTVETTGVSSDTSTLPTTAQVKSFVESKGYQTSSDVSTAIGTAIAATYKPAGSKAANELTSSLLVAGNLGNVYNLSTSITIAAADKTNWVENAENSYPAGTNVVIVDVGTTGSPNYKFDALAGMIDLSPYATSASLSNVATTGNYTDLSNKPSLATVATSGNYTDLSNKPTLFSGSYTDLSNKPSLATVATSGSYNDLSNKPSLATVATSGSYNDLSNKPAIPSYTAMTAQDLSTGTSTTATIVSPKVIADYVDNMLGVIANGSY